MRMDLIVVAKKLIKAMLFWHTCRSTPTSSPLAEPTSGVPSFLQHAGNRSFASAKGCSARIVPYRTVSHVLAGHHARPQWPTNRCRGQRLRETDSLGSHPVNIGSAKSLIAHVRQFVIRQFIRHDVHDVGQPRDLT